MFKHQLRLARYENQVMKQFNTCFKETVAQDKNFHHDCDGERSWDYDGIQIVRESTPAEEPCIGRPRKVLTPSYSLYIPIVIFATRWDPEDVDYKEVGDFETFDKALLAAMMEQKGFILDNFQEGEFWAKEAECEARGDYKLD